MLREVVVAEFCVVFCLCSVTLVLRYLIHQHRSVRSMWKVCPALCALLIIVIPTAVLDLFVPVLWNAAILGALANEPRNAYLLASPVLIGIALDYAYSSVTIAIFLQRIFYLLFPTGNIKKLNNVVFSVLGASAIGCAIVTFVLILINVSSDEKPLPPGCFSFNCMAIKDPSVRVFPHTVTTVFSGVILVCGTFMFALIYKHRKQRQNATCVKIRKFALYVFYLRLVFETIPYGLDVALSEIADIQLGQYVGPFGALASVLDITLTTAMYYKLFRPPKPIATSSTRTH